jgi:hypothetical protein
MESNDEIVDPQLMALSAKMMLYIKEVSMGYGDCIDYLMNKSRMLDALIDYLDLEVKETTHGSLVKVKHYTFKKRNKKEVR